MCVRVHVEAEGRMKRHIVSVFKPHGQGLAQLFGSLEADIMALIWERQEASARDIFEGLRDQGQRLSYGATKTVLDRLVKKQVLVRTLNGNQYTYRARLDREEFTNSAISEILNGLFNGFGAPAYARALDQIQLATPDDPPLRTRSINEPESPQ